jgi:hypothetical protein
VDVVVDDISTSLSKSELTELITNCFDYELGTTTGFPFEYSTKTISNSTGNVLVATDLDHNAIALHRFLYDDYNYTPSSTVKNISANVVSKSGYSNTLDLNTFQVEDDPDSIVTK